MKLLTAKEVAPILQVKLARVYTLARERAIPAVRVGEKQLRFDESALREWIARGGTAFSGEGSGEEALQDAGC